MADKDDFSDEYQFADLDAGNPNEADDSVSTATDTTKFDGPAVTGIGKNDVVKKGVIVLIVVFVVIVAYKIIGSFSSDKKIVIQKSAEIIPPVPAAPPQLTPVSQTPAYVTNQPPVSNGDSKVSQKLTELESTQQSMRTDVSSVNDQLGGISKNVDSLIAKLNDLNTVIANLSVKVDEQSHEIDQLTMQRIKPKKVQHVVRKGIAYPKYFLQAVIPGRAWLIATNGATLTVREGTVVAGYGMVKLIDPRQGRVTTSSGQVIRFSQEDS